MEVVEFSCMALVDCPGFSAVQERGQHSGVVNLGFGLQSDAPSVPYICAESAKCRVCLG